MIFHSLLFTILLIAFILVCASLFSFLETATVAISEHKLKLMRDKYRWAKYAYLLKQQLNSVLIFSLFGNSLFNAVFTTLSAIIVAELLHGLDTHIILPLTTVLIAFFIIIFSEALPKIIASKSPLRTLSLISVPLYYLFLLCKPIVWFIDKLVYFITMFLNISHTDTTTAEELKSIIADKSSPFSGKHKSILLNSIDMQTITVKEVLIPLRMVESIDISGDMEVVEKKIFTTHHTQIIVYENTIDNIIGFIHVKDILPIDDIHEDSLRQILRPINFVNDFTPIIKQIQRAQKLRNRIFVVINEYGDILGIACLEDMFEMIFGDFTTESPKTKQLVVKNELNQLIVDGAMLIRELNELYHLDLPASCNTLTVNGLVLKTLNTIPNLGVCFKIKNIIFEVINIGPYWVERVKISYI
jgi:Mg2+/Co2+ transporter CorB